MLDRVKPLLEVKNVTQRYRGSADDEDGPAVLEGMSTVLNEGEIVGLLGRSGCGKSTLLRIVSGLIRPSSGEVIYQGEKLEGPADGVAMVFQSFALFPWLSVLENVEIGLKALKVPAAEARQRLALRAAVSASPGSPARRLRSRGGGPPQHPAHG